MEKKRQHGRYFTQVIENPLRFQPFQAWMEKHGLEHESILEPFAGSNNLITMIKQASWDGMAHSYDLFPQHDDVQKRDTIKDFPQKHRFCLTNPPWLARNSATRRGMAWRYSYDDLYKHCLHLCLEHCDYVAAFLPASFLHRKALKERLEIYILLHDKRLFLDTDNPCCLALFSKEPARDVAIWYDNRSVGKYQDLQRALPQNASKTTIRFNDPQGTLGLIAFDNTKEESIRFCDVSDVASYSIKVSSRFITRISGVDGSTTFIKKANETLALLRKKTHDLFLTPFKGLRADGFYRRRIAFKMAQDLLCSL